MGLEPATWAMIGMAVLSTGATAYTMANQPDIDQPDFDAPKESEYITPDKGIFKKQFKTNYRAEEDDTTLGLSKIGGTTILGKKLSK